MVKGFLFCDDAVYLDIQADGPGAEEPAEDPLRAAHARELLGEVLPSDDHRPGLAHRGKAAHVVPVRMGENDVPDRRAGDLAQCFHRPVGALFGSTGIDGDHACLGDQEGDVREVETFGDIDSVAFAHEPWLGKSEPVVWSNGDVSQDGWTVESLVP